MKKSIAMLALALVSTAAEAAVVLDQSNTGPGYGSGGIFVLGTSTNAWNNDFRRVQTFTVGKAGTLAKVEVEYYGLAPTGFNILDTVSGVPSSIIGTGAIGANSEGIITFATSIPVAVGDVLGFEVVGNGQLEGSAGRPYTRGADYFSSVPVYPSFTYNNLSESYFQTFVDTDQVAAPVPEPGEWAMIATGLGIVGGLVRRRKS